MTSSRYRALVDQLRAHDSSSDAAYPADYWDRALQILDTRLGDVPERLADLHRITAGEGRGFRQFGAGSHRYQLRDPAPVDQVRAFEREHDVNLPEDYRLFLVALGEGGAGPGYGLYTLDQALNECPLGLDDLSAPFPHTGPGFSYLTRPEGADEDHPDYEEIDVPFDGFLPLADFGCGSWAGLVVAGPERGTMWIFFDCQWEPCRRYGQPALQNPADRLSFSDWYLSRLDAAWSTDGAES